MVVPLDWETACSHYSLDVSMATRNSSASAKPKGGQSGRKRTPPPKPPRHIPWGVVGASVLVAAFAIAVIVYAAMNKSASTTPTTAAKGNPAKAVMTTAPPPWPVPSNEVDYIAKAGLPVLPSEGNVEHYHAHLDIFNNGQKVDVAQYIGIVPAAGKISPLHTHDVTGVLHVESEQKGKTFTLGMVFTEWGVKLNSTQVGGLKASPTTPLSFYVDGKPFTGNPSSIVLKAHQEIAVVYGTAPKQIPSSYQFPAGE